MNTTQVNKIISNNEEKIYSITGTREEIKKQYKKIFNSGTNQEKILMKLTKDPYIRASINFMLTQCNTLYSIFNTSLGGEGVYDMLSQEANNPILICRNAISRNAININENPSAGKNKLIREILVNSSDLLPLDGKYFLIYGPCQSGKSLFIQLVALSHILYNKCSVIVILRNCVGDSKQLRERSDQFIISHHEAIRTHQGVSFDKKRTLNYIYVGDTKDSTKLKSALSGETPSMIIAIANDTQMKRIKTTLDTIKNPKIVVTIDESDQVAYGNDNVAFRETFHNSILNKASRVYAVTATSFDTIFSEDKIKNGNIIVMKPKGVYKGLKQIQLIALDKTVTPASGKNTWFDNDTNLLPVMREMREVNDKNVYNDIMGSRESINYNHPIILLVKNSHLNDKQLLLLNKISTDPTLNNWNGIVYNGKGIYVYSPHIRYLNKMQGGVGDREKIGEPVAGFRNCLLFKGQQISAGLQYFYKLNDKIIKRGKIITHIVIVAGDMADRGISFVSTNRKWHVTSMYYVPPVGASIANKIQAAGRLCGNFNDAIPLKMYSPRQVLVDVLKGIHIQEEMLSRAKSYKGNFSVMESVGKMKFNKNKIPSKKFGVKECPIKKENLVEGSDLKYGGVSRNVYRKDITKIIDVRTVVKFPGEKKEREEKVQVDEQVDEQVEVQNLTSEQTRLVNMFKKWAILNTTIANFMKLLQPRRLYSESEFKLLVKQSSIKMVDIFLYERPSGVSKGYGEIMKRINGTIQLDPVLVYYYCQYFN
jgi:hypothetical protein